MFESDLDGSKIRISAENIFRVESDILILYEVKEYSHIYKRLTPYLNQRTQRQEIKQNAILKYFMVQGLAFKSIMLFDAIECQITPNVRLMNEFAEWANGLMTNIKRISINITEHQDVEPYKMFIDKIMSKKKIEVHLVGTTDGIKYMMNYLNQSGHMLQNACINASEAIRAFFDRLSCSNCKKLDPNCRLKQGTIQVLCQKCCIHGAYADHSIFASRNISRLRDTCYCSKDYYLPDKLNHLATCNTAIFKCNLCPFEGGQSDLVYHVTRNHQKNLIDEMNSLTNKPIDKTLKKQCMDCGDFYEQNRNCLKCARKKST
ncbi:hypothetical protein SteCoe_32316 [Stentor coeruleus]|uniref:Uncharacterized protein n=1 Tax=Stentor coeruleus TaxID=5963 RepID=A0A1R2AZ83_9CILI|nr:hypothetical protein SteCoe_32316 [Stentor coeruleus]